MTHDAELAKQRYARELAAYTLQQWNIAREKQAERERDKKKTDSPQPRRSPRPPSPKDSQSDDETTVAALKAVDYALRSAPRQNGDI